MFFNIVLLEPLTKYFSVSLKAYEHLNLFAPIPKNNSTSEILYILFNAFISEYKSTKFKFALRE